MTQITEAKRELAALRGQWRMWRDGGPHVDFGLICPEQCGKPDCEPCAVTAYRKERMAEIAAQAKVIKATIPAEPFPHSQHWNIDGWRITVLLYKRHRGPCSVCGARPARHAVWAGRVDRSEPGSGAPADFCDEHRPAKGSLPPLDYGETP
jgi:hypothetical protein